jgi:GTP-binding protein
VKIEASFVRSAASASDLPHDALAEIALVGRSNVGKSSLINALVRQRIARTSAAPGKTRLANLYRVERGGGDPLYLVDLPGYGYARGGSDFAQLLHEYFEGGRTNTRGGTSADLTNRGAILLVDSRHPGLQSDIDAWGWLQAAVERRAIVGTKLDKLTRAERIRAMRELESVFEHPVLAVSAVTGEGLDELWTLIDTLTTNSSRRQRPPNPSPLRPRKGTAARRPKK